MQKFIKIFISIGLLISVVIVLMTVRKLDFNGVAALVSERMESKIVDTTVPAIPKRTGAKLLEAPCETNFKFQIFRTSCFQARCQIEIQMQNSTGQTVSYLNLEDEYIPAGAISFDSAKQVSILELDKTDGQQTSVKLQNVPLTSSRQSLLITISNNDAEGPPISSYSHVVWNGQRLIRSWVQTDLSGEGKVEIEDINGDVQSDIIYFQPRESDGKKKTLKQIFSWSEDLQKTIKVSESTEEP